MKMSKKSTVKALLSDADLNAIGDLMGGLMDKQVAILTSKNDLENAVAPLASKQDLADLKSYMNEGFEAVMEGMDAISEKLAEKQKVEMLIAWAREVGEKVGVKPRV